MTTLFPTTHFFYDSVIFSQERLRRSICQRHLVEWLQPSILSGVIIFDSDYLLRPATLLEDVEGSLFNHSNISHPSVFVLFVFFFNWDSPHERLNSHYEAWSYKKRNTKRITGYRKSV